MAEDATTGTLLIGGRGCGCAGTSGVTTSAAGAGVNASGTLAEMAGTAGPAIFTGEYRNPPAMLPIARTIAAAATFCHILRK